MNEDKAYILKGSLINLLGTITKLVSPVLVILLARIFSQEEFGMYISVQLFAITLSRITVLGLDKGLIWYIPRSQKLKQEPSIGIAESLYFTTFLSFLLMGAMGLMLWAGGLKFFPGLSGVSPTFIMLCLISLIAFPSLYIFAGSMEGIRLPAYKIVINQFLVTSSAPLIAIFLRMAGVGANALPLGFTISNLGGCILYLLIFKKRFPSFSWNRPPKPDRVLLSYSLPLGLTEILSGLLLRVDLWMITLLLGPKKRCHLCHHAVIGQRIAHYSPGV